MQYKYRLVMILASMFSMSVYAESTINTVTPDMPPVPATSATSVTPDIQAIPVATAPPDTLKQTANYKIALALGSDDGGDTLMSGVYANGSKWDIRSNSGYVIKAGMIFPINSFETQMMVGYKSDSTSASNGKVSFSNMQVEVLESYHPQDFRIGLGIAYITNSKFEVSLPGGTNNGVYKLKDTTAGIIQIGWAPKDKIYSIDLRYTVAKLTPSNFTTSSFSGAKTEYSGNVIGLIGGLNF